MTADGSCNQARRTTPLRAFRTGVALLAIFLAGCGESPDPVDDGALAAPPFIESGDLPNILERGKLRILFPRGEQATHLPRRGFPLDFERDLAEEYARSQGLEPVWIFVESRSELIPSLLSGRGDLVAANLTVTEQRKREVAFTVPLAVVREQLVGRADDTGLDDVASLAGRTVAVRGSSSYRETLRDLRERYPKIGVLEVSERLDTEGILDEVAEGGLDVTIADSNLVEVAREYLAIRPMFDVTGDRAISWAVRPNSDDLLASLDRFLTAAHLTERELAPSTGDLDRIEERKVLRVLTRNSAASYFLWRGQLMGFEYDLARMFAGRRGLRVEMIVPPPGEDLLEWLREGRGDIVAAGLTPTEERTRSGVRFSRAYNHVQQVVVTDGDDVELDEPADLEERTFHVRRSSAYWNTLADLQTAGIGLRLEAAPEKLPTEEIIARVADLEYDLTLADSNIVDIELSWRTDIRRAFPLGERVPVAWAVRGDNPLLLAAVNEFIDSEYRGLFYNVKYDLYFGNHRKMRNRRLESEDRTSGLSPYDELAKKYAGEYGFDWRLIVAQMYQESRFDPEALSFAGAHGLMQLLPRTAEELGFCDMADPDQGIHAGVKYLDWVRDRFEPELPVRDRMWFTLAAYNAGTGHVRDARRLAARMGLNPNRWFDNVEEAMLLLSQRQYAQAAPHGYCRCREPVDYVREIRSRYNAYLETTGS